MVDNPTRQHSRIENSPSPPLSFAGFPNTLLQFYDPPRRTGNNNIRLSGFLSDTIPLKTSNDWHVPFRYAFLTCPRVSFVIFLPSNSAENTMQLIKFTSTPCSVQTLVKIRNLYRYLSKLLIQLYHITLSTIFQCFTNLPLTFGLKL